MEGLLAPPHHPRQREGLRAPPLWNPTAPGRAKGCPPWTLPLMGTCALALRSRPHFVGTPTAR